MQQAGLIHKGEVVVGKPKPDGSTYVKKMGYLGTGKWLSTSEEAWDYAMELMEDNRGEA